MQSHGPTANKIQIYYDRKILSAEIQPFLSLLQRCLSGTTQHGDNVEKLKGGDIYSVRANKKGRILIKFEMVLGVKSLIVLEILPNHEYHKSKYLKSKHNNKLNEHLTSLKQNIGFEFEQVKVIDELESQTNANTEISATPIFNHMGSYIVFDQSQEAASGSSLPLIIEGPPGSGKTSIAVDMIQQNCIAPNKKILYVTQSPYLTKMIAKQLTDCNSTHLDTTVHIKTYSDLMPKRNPSSKISKGEDIFKEWFQSLNPKKVKIPESICSNVDLLYQEFRIISGYELKDYTSQKGIGRKQCLFQEGNDRVQIGVLFEKWLAYLTDHNITLPEFDPGLIIEGNEQYDLVIVDESQDFSHRQLKNLMNIAKDRNIVFCLDRKQNLSDENPKRIYLEKLLHCEANNKRLNIIDLPTHYRCPSVIMDFAVIFDELRQSFKPKNKTENLISKTDQKGGAVFWVNPTKDKSETEQLNGMKDNINICIVTHERFKEEARQIFSIPQIFTPAQVKGLEFDTVVMYNILNTEDFVNVNKMLKPKSPTKASVIGEDLNSSAALSSCFVAATRARQRLYIVQDQSKNLDMLIKLLKQNIQGQSVALSSLGDKALSSTSKSWIEQADKYEGIGLHEQAKVARAKAKELAAKESDQALAQVTDEVEKLTISEKTTGKDSNNLRVRANNTRRRKKNNRNKNNQRNRRQQKNARGNGGVIASTSINNTRDPALLHVAAKNGDAAKCIKLIESGIDVNTPDRNGYTALHIAIINRHKKTVKILIEGGANVEFPDKLGRTSLMIAVYEGSLDVIKMLIKNGANVNKKGRDGVTALMWAAELGNTYAIDELVNNGANMDEKDDLGCTALMRAANCGHIDAVKVLVNHGANINTINHDGKTALMWAARYGITYQIDGLINNGANVNATSSGGWTALMIASCNGHIDAVKVLIENGAFVDEKNEDGRTALMLAAIKGYVGICKLLLDAEADVNVAAKGNALTVLHIVVFLNLIDLCKMLIAAGVNVNCTDKHGRTPLMHAAMKGHKEFCDLLLKANADVNILDNSKRTALQLVGNKKNQEVYELLNNAKKKLTHVRCDEVDLGNHVQGYLPSGGVQSSAIATPNQASGSESTGDYSNLPGSKML